MEAANTINSYISQATPIYLPDEYFNQRTMSSSGYIHQPTSFEDAFEEVYSRICDLERKFYNLENALYFDYKEQNINWIKEIVNSIKNRLAKFKTPKYKNPNEYQQGINDTVELMEDVIDNAIKTL